MTETDHRRLALLGLLHHTGGSGYQLHVHAAGMGLIGLKRPAAYNLLDTMVRKGWLTATAPEEEGRTQREYELTDAGRDATLDLLRTWLPTPSAPDLPGLVSLAWLELLPREEALDLLKQRRQALLAERPADGEDPDHPGVIGLVLAHAQRVRESELDLVDQLLAELDHGGAS